MWGKRMKTILTLVALSFFVGCRHKLPPLPQIKYHYAIEVRNEAPDLESDAKFMRIVTNRNSIAPMPYSEDVRCLKFKVVSMYPYKIEYIGQVPLIECDLVGGYKPKDLNKFLNWVDDVYNKFN